MSVYIEPPIATKRGSTSPLTPVPSESCAMSPVEIQEILPVKTFALPQGAQHWKLSSLLAHSSNFVEIDRISALKGKDYVAGAIKEHEKLGKPLIVEDFHKLPEWNEDLFSLESFTRAMEGKEDVTARNMYTREDVRMPFPDLVKKCREVFPSAQPDETERYYGKDLPCPSEWSEALNLLPPHILPFGSEDAFTYLHPDDRPESLMTYLGVGATYTPCHKDPCASLGHNLMTYTCATDARRVKVEKEPVDSDQPSDGVDASAFWFMTETKNARDAEAYLRSLGQELDAEDHFATLDELAKAPFQVYVCQQKLGDLVLVPRMSCHQVVNHGGISIKTSWSRMSVDCLQPALQLELPLYRRVCRPETYRVKLLTLKSLEHYTDALAQDVPLQQKGRDAAVLRDLLYVFDNILSEEYHKAHKEMTTLKEGITISSDLSETDRQNVLVCDCCSGDIFQSFFECRKCNGGDPHNIYHICPTCYVEGRSCRCVIMVPKMLRPWSVLLSIRNDATRALTQFNPNEVELQPWPTDDDIGDNPKHVQIFTAACMLRQTRVAVSKSSFQRPLRSCNRFRNRNGRHEVRYESVLNCSTCHAGTCLQHLLEKEYIHSAEALLAHGKNKETFHNVHRMAKTRWIDAIEKDKSLIWTETPLRLVNAALNHPRYSPRDSRTVRGWYDETDEEDEEEDEIAYPQGSTRPSVAHPDEAGSDTSECDQLLSARIGTDDEMMGSSHKTKGRSMVRVQPGSHGLASLKRPSGKRSRKDFDDAEYGERPGVLSGRRPRRAANTLDSQWSMESTVPEPSRKRVRAGEQNTSSTAAASQESSIQSQDFDPMAIDPVYASSLGFNGVGPTTRAYRNLVDAGPSAYAGPASAPSHHTSEVASFLEALKNLTSNFEAERRETREQNDRFFQTSLDRERRLFRECEDARKDLVQATQLQEQSTRQEAILRGEVNELRQTIYQMEHRLYTMEQREKYPPVPPRYEGPPIMQRIEYPDMNRMDVDDRPRYPHQAEARPPPPFTNGHVGREPTRSPPKAPTRPSRSPNNRKISLEKRISDPDDSRVNEPTSTTRPRGPSLVDRVMPRPDEQNRGQPRRGDGRPNRGTRRDSLRNGTRPGYDSYRPEGEPSGWVPRGYDSYRPESPGHDNTAQNGTGERHNELYYFNGTPGPHTPPGRPPPELVSE